MTEVVPHDAELSSAGQHLLVFLIEAMEDHNFEIAFLLAILLLPTIECEVGHGQDRDEVLA